MNRAEMKAVLEQTLELQSQNEAFTNLNEQQPDAHLSDPIDMNELSRLTDFMARRGLPLPPSYVQLLHISNGIKDYMQLESLSLRTASELMEPEEDDDEWSDFSPLHEFVIASGNTSAFIAFDRNDVSPAGEMAVVWVDESGGTNRFENLPEFLLSQLAYQRDVLTANQGDRAQLPKD